MEMGFGRVFRKLGLPFWTFVGVGVSAIWFNTLGSLVEKLARDTLVSGEKPPLMLTYVPTLLVFAMPFVAVLTAYLYQRSRFRLSKLRLKGGGLARPGGKRGLILLVSNKESALFAIRYHFEELKKLEKVWLIPSNSSEAETFGPSSGIVAEEIKKECEALELAAGRPLEVVIHRSGVSPADSQDTFDYVRRIFRSEEYEPGELIADFTGGTKPMSVGVIMACLPSERELEYVSFNPAKGSHGPFLIDYQHRAFDLIG
jgi:hypothetical protein